MPRPTSDRDWIRPLLLEHERALVAYARSITGDLERARDAVQEAFLELCGARREDVEPNLEYELEQFARRSDADFTKFFIHHLAFINPHFGLVFYPFPSFPESVLMNPPPSTKYHWNSENKFLA